MKKLRFLLSFICLIVTGIIQANEGNGSVLKNEMTLHLGAYLNNDGALLGDLSYSRLFNQYIGVGLGLEFSQQIFQDAHTGVINGVYARETEWCKDINWLVFNPYLVLRSPRFFVSTDAERECWVQAEPGIGLGITQRGVKYELLQDNLRPYPVLGYASYVPHSYRWFLWRSRFSLNMSINKWVFGIGFGISNLDYYSARRGLHLPAGLVYTVPARQLSYSMDLSVGFCF